MKAHLGGSQNGRDQRGYSDQELQQHCYWKLPEVGVWAAVSQFRLWALLQRTEDKGSYRVAKPK